MTASTPYRDAKTVLPNGDDKKVTGTGHRSSGKTVIGHFKNIENPGVPHSFYFREFRGQPVRLYTMYEGVEYEVPVEVADHLNSVGEKEMDWVNASGVINPGMQGIKSANPVSASGGIEGPQQYHKVKRIKNRFAFVVTKRGK